MAEPLRLNIEVDASQLGKFSSGAQQTAASVRAMEDSFQKGASAAAHLAQQLMQEGESAGAAASMLKNLGYSATETKEAMALLGIEMEKNAAKISAMDRAMASGAVRIAASELGVGQLGFSLARVGAASSVLAPILQYAFPVMGAIALVGIADDLYKKLQELSLEGLHNAEAWEKIDLAGSMSLQSIDRQIDTAQDKVVELTSGKLAALQLEMKQIGDGAEQMASHMVGLFDAIGTQLEKETPLFEKVRDFYTFMSTGLLMPSQGELAKAFGADLAETLDIEGLDAGIDKVTNQIRIVNGELNKTPGDKQLEEYARQLIRVLGLLEARKTLEDRQKDVKGAEINKAAEDAVKKEAEERHRQIIAELDDAERAAKEKTRILQAAAKENAEANRRMDEEAKRNAEEGARQLVMAYQAAFDRIAAAGQAGMRKATAEGGVEKQAVSDNIWLTAHEKKLAIMAIEIETMKKQEAALTDERNALSIEEFAVKQSAMSDDEKTRKLEALRKKIEQVNAELQALGIKLKGTESTLGSAKWDEMGKAMEQAATSGFNAFNTGFIKMITGGQTFARTMQNAWSAMAESFITSVLKMGEQWLVSHLLMAAAQKTMEVLGLATHSTAVAAKIAEDKAAGVAQVGLAGAGGVASMAAAHVPLAAAIRGCCGIVPTRILLFDLRRHAVLQAELPAEIWSVSISLR